MVEYIPIARPTISEPAIAAVTDLLRAGRLAAGEQVGEFEAAFANAVGSRHAIATSSGTAALQAALHALALPRESLVITTPFSFFASASAIVDAGLVPVFADIDEATFNISPDAVLAALRKYGNVRAVVGVHLYGLPFSPELVGLCRERGLALVEDAAQAHGAGCEAGKAGALGTVAAFSFYGTKNMTTGEGGMVTTGDSDIAARARLFINHGQRARYEHIALGFNHRMTELQAVIGLSQLAELEQRNEQRRARAAYYNAALCDAVAVPCEPAGLRHVYHQYTIRCRDRARLQTALTDAAIGYGVYYPRLIPDQPAFAHLPHLVEPCPVARRLTGEVLSLPVHPAVSEEGAARVVSVVLAAAGSDQL